MLIPHLPRLRHHLLMLCQKRRRPFDGLKINWTFFFNDKWHWNLMLLMSSSKLLRSVEYRFCLDKLHIEGFQNGLAHHFSFARRRYFETYHKRNCHVWKCHECFIDDGEELEFRKFLCESCRDYELKKWFFWYITMPFCEELKTVLLLSRNEFVLGVLVIVVKKLFQNDEEIEELYLRLEDCEEKN